jgi:hypothetical protein
MQHELTCSFSAGAPFSSIAYWQKGRRSCGAGLLPAGVTLFSGQLEFIVHSSARTALRGDLRRKRILQ